MARFVCGFTLSTLLAVAGLVAGGCSSPRPEPEPKAAPADVAPVERSASFINRVWVVAESTGMTPGQLVIFLSDSTLVFASPHARPAFGTWRREGDRLVMVEEGLSYPTDIVALGASEFRIRSHNPGGVVETRFVLAP